MLHFGYMSSIFWWAIIAFNMALEVYIRPFTDKIDKRCSTWSRIVAYHVVGWFIPFVMMVVVSSSGRMAFEASGTYCFISPEDDKVWQIVFWFVPCGIALLVGCTSFIAFMVRVVVESIRLKKFLTYFLMYIRVIVFMMIFLTGSVIIFSYSIQITNDYADIQSGIKDYYACLIRGQTCSLSESVSNYNLIMLKGFAMSCFGVFMFIIFLSLHTFRFWYDIMRSLSLSLYHRKPYHARKALMGILSDRSTATSDHTMTLTTDNTMTAKSDDNDMEEEDEEEEVDGEERTKDENGTEQLSDVDEYVSSSSE